MGKYSQHKAGSNARSWKVNSGEKAYLFLIGDAKRYYHHFDSNQKSDTWQEGFTKKYDHQIAVLENGTLVPNKWTFGQKVMEQIIALDEAGINFDSTLLMVTASGEGKNKVTNLMVSPKQAPPATLAALLDLKAKKQTVGDFDSFNEREPEDDIIF